MRFSIDFLKAFLLLLRHLFPIWGGITILITLAGFWLARLEGLSIGEGLYFAWITGTTVGYGDFTPTTGPSQLLAIVVAILGILFTGIAVSLALEAAKLSIQKNGSLNNLRESAEERLDKRAVNSRNSSES